MSEIELEPCPFCGEQAELRNDDDEVMREVVCPSCDFAITESANPEGAVARWNTRPLTNLTPSGVERGLLDFLHTELAVAIAFLGRGPGGTNNADPAKWGAMCDQIGTSLVEADKRVLAALALPSEPPSQGDGWRFDMEAAPANCLIFDPKWGVYEGLRFDGGNWGIATFNGSIIGASPVAWRPKPEAHALKEDGRP